MNHLTKRRKEILCPPALMKGDRIAIIAPASAVKEEYVRGAAATIREYGYEPVIFPSALGEPDGSYSDTVEVRAKDLSDALKDPDIKVILCARGGYGCVHLLKDFSYDMVSSRPKWLIGFSDVSALLGMWHSAGIASVHGPMAKHLAVEGPEDLCTKALFNLLESGGKFDYYLPSSPHNVPGKAEGVLKGGNMAVLSGLADTVYDLLSAMPEEDVILFMEDISEPIYAVERMLYRLYYNGTLGRVKGLIFGQFTEYKPDKNYETIEEMIETFFKYLMPTGPGVPIVFDFPVGHVALNYPLTVGAKVSLEVTKDYVSLHSIF